jgi:Domain of unknown function (DUF4118)
MTELDASAGRIPSVLKRDGLSILLVFSAVLVTLLLQPAAVVMPLFSRAVILSAWFGGMGSGPLALVLSSLALEYSLLEPLKGFAIGLSDLLYLLAFALLALLVSWLSPARTRTADALRRAHGAMEANVQERTAGLRQDIEPLQIEIAERKGGMQNASSCRCVRQRPTRRLWPRSIASGRWSIRSRGSEAEAQTFQCLFVSQQAQCALGYWGPGDQPQTVCACRRASRTRWR